MSSSDIKIVITATDKASTAFADVVDSAEKLGPALEDASTGASKLKPAAEGAATSLGPLPGKIDDLSTSASNAKQPLTDAGSSASGLGTAISDAGDKIPGAAGDIVSSLGDLVTASDEAKTATTAASVGMSALKIAAVAAAAAFGPLVIGAALSVASVAIEKLSGMLSGADSLGQHFDETRASAQKLNEEILKTAAGIDDTAQALTLYNKGNDLNNLIQDYSRLIEMNKKFTGGNPLGDFGSQDAYNQAVADTITLTAKYGLTVDDVMKGNVNLSDELDQLTSAQSKYNAVLAVTGPGQDAIRARLAEMVTGLQDGSMSMEDFIWNLDYIQSHLSDYAQQGLIAEQYKKISKAAFDASVNVGLLNTDVEKLAASGTHTAAIDLAVNFDQSALENTFNVIVGGSNRLGQSAQAVADWSAGLNDASDGMSDLQRVTSKNLITQDDYNAAVESNTKIQAANLRIQDDVVAIQAKQAPLLANLTEQQAAYMDTLAGMPAEQQLVTLGFLDSAEAAKAMQLSYLAADAAAGNLGDTGEATATKIITAAANADPVMKAMLEDMGLISEGADGTITVNFPTAESITTAVDNLSTSIDNLTAAINGIPDAHNTDITATDSASGTIANIREQLDSIPAVTSAVVQVSVQTTGTIPANGSLNIGGGRDGGVIGMANGGMVTAELGEAGPELLTFRDGGQALVPLRGLYTVPVGTHVLPAPATASKLANGNGSVSFDMRGSVIVITADSPDVEDAFRQWAISQSRLN